jgi:hypothetical protein
MLNLYGLHPQTIKRRAIKRAAESQRQFLANKNNETKESKPSECNEPADSPIFQTVPQYFSIDSSFNIAYEEEEEYFITDDDMIDPEKFLFDQDDLDFEEGEEEEEEEGIDDKHLLQLLRDLVVKRRLRQRTVRDILSIFRYCSISVPKTSYGLFNRGKTTPILIKSINGGEYHHHGIKKALLERNMKNLSDIDIIKIDIGIDGIPLFSSSNSSMWPILGRTTNTVYKKPFVIGAFVGPGKPKKVNEYLFDLVEEIKKINENGLTMADGTIKQVEIQNFLCDSPGRSFATAVKSHAARQGCMNCEEPAVYNKEFKKMVYSTTAGIARTDESYAARKITEQHLAEHQTPNSHVLEKINIGMVSQFPTDIMHLVDLGVSKRMAALLYKENCLHLKRPFLSSVSNAYANLRFFIPSEFQRKTRSLDQLPFWKATEGRLFMLYTGLVFFKMLRNENAFQHYILLNIALRLLSHDTLYRSNIQCAQNFIEVFVENYGMIYGVQNITFNVHNLLHLPACASQHGPLYSFSCYAFENYMQAIKGYVRSPHKILQQMFNRIEEENLTSNDKANRNAQKFYYPEKEPFDGCSKSYSGYKFGNFVLNNKQRDRNCALKNGTHIAIRNFSIKDSETVVVFQEYDKDSVQSFFDQPVDSREIGIFLYSTLLQPYQICSINEIDHKCMQLPYDDKFLIIPIIHAILEEDFN